jgi:hypothetical protein
MKGIFDSLLDETLYSIGNSPEVRHKIQVSFLKPAEHPIPSKNLFRNII